MNRFIIYIIKILKRFYVKIFNIRQVGLLCCETNPDLANQIIYKELTNDKPCMVARLGATELNILVNYLGVKQQNHNIWKYIKGEIQPWWWERIRVERMQNWSGFFPPTIEKIEQFC